MTVSYTAEVSSCRGFGCFLKLLLRSVIIFTFYSLLHSLCMLLNKLMYWKSNKNLRKNLSFRKKLAIYLCESFQNYFAITCSIMSIFSKKNTIYIIYCNIFFIHLKNSGITFFTKKKPTLLASDEKSALEIFSQLIDISQFFS